MVKRRLKSHNNEEDDDYMDNRPSFFNIVLQGSNNQYLQIPEEFSKQLSRDLSDTATLKTPSCRCWSVKVNQTPNGLFITKGWQEFLKDNSLGHNDFLLFTYVGNMCFSVQIFDMSGCEIDYPRPPSIKTHYQSASPKRKTPKGRNPPCIVHRRWLKASKNCSGVVKEIESFDSKFPYFRSVVRRWTMPVPKSFSDAHLPHRKSGIVLRNWAGKKWVVNSCPNLKGLHSLCGGWSEFRNANKLKLDDVCIFELVGRLEMLVHVFWNRQSDPKRKNCLGRPRKIPDRSVHLPISVSSEDLSDGFKEEEYCNSIFPHFTKRIRGNTIPIPASISKVYLPNKKFKMVLRNLKGKEWLVNVISNSHGIRFISAGWSAFRNANKLKQGDTCAFQLIDKEKFQVRLL